MSSTSAGVRLARVLALASVAVLVPVGFSDVSVAGTYGRVTGTVTGPSGLAASTIDVHVMHLDDFGRWTSVGSDSTDREGRFEIWAPPGTHRLWFKPYLETSVYLPEYYPDATSVELASDITVSSDSHEDFAVQLETGPHATVHGTVVGSDGAPVPGVEVWFWTDQGTAEEPWWVWRFLDETDEMGRFREVVKPGVYRVSYRRADYVESFFGGLDAVETASDVMLAETDETALDTVIRRVTRFQGYVRSAHSSLPIAGSRVDFYRNNGTPEDPLWSRIGQTSPSWETGAYSMRVPPGVYLVRAVDPYGEYLAEYYGKAFSPATATTVAIADESTVRDLSIRMTRRDAAPMGATGAPTISGSAHVGATLLASPGTWSPTPDRVTYQWFADGTEVAGATQSSYQPLEADLGRRISVRALAYTSGRLPATQTSVATAPVEPTPTASVEKVPSTTRMKATKRGTRVRLDISVRAAVPVTGTVRIFRGSRLLRTHSLESGKVSATLRRQPRGTWRYKAIYRGSATVLRSDRVVRLTV